MVSSGESLVAARDSLPPQCLGQSLAPTRFSLYTGCINTGWLSGKITQEKVSGQQPSIFQKDPYVFPSTRLGALTNEKTLGQ